MVADVAWGQRRVGARVASAAHHSGGPAGGASRGPPGRGFVGGLWFCGLRLRHPLHPQGAPKREPRRELTVDEEPTRGSPPAGGRGGAPERSSESGGGHERVVGAR